MVEETAEPQEWQSLIDEYAGRTGAAGAGWSIDRGASSEWWLAVYPPSTVLPQQGWKLHLSACVISAEAVLQAALPVLFAEAVAFKVIGSRRRLHALNEGRAGFSQIGKFITVYPPTDAHAVLLAARLHQATAGLRGPAIPSDRPLVPGSIVYYRYGSFQKRDLQLPNGELVPALITPDGSLIADRRADGYNPPHWAIDPFLAAGVAAELPPVEAIFDRRYILLETLHQAAGGAVARALDLHTRRLCILKRAARDAAISPTGRDARDRLRHEAALLALLDGKAPVPQALDLFELDAVSGDLCLVLENIPGTTLAARIAEHNALGRQVPATQIVTWGMELADALAQLHAQGIVHGDVKSTNVVVTPDQRVRLLDFNSAYDLGSSDPPDLMATSGYADPTLAADAPPTTGTDMYSLGALLYALATGTEPALAPQPAALLNRPIRLLNPTISPALEAVIVRCLEPDPARRFPSMAALRSTLAALDPPYTVPEPSLGAMGCDADEAAEQRRCERLARQLGAALCRNLLPAANVSGISRNLYDGAAGTVVVLAALADAFKCPLYRTTLAEWADRLGALPPPPGATVAGLYVGEAGISAALLAAGLVLGKQSLVEAAAERGAWIGTLPYMSPALLHGTAGRVQLHLWLWDATGDRAQLQHAVAAGSALLASATEEANQVFWTMPQGYGEASGHAYLGYALGAAGIGDALLELFAATDDERFLHAAQGAARWIAGHAVATLDGQGVAWPERIGEGPKRCCWYHGSAGIGRFFRRCDQLGAFPAVDLAVRAAYMVARGARWAGPSQAWGLAGNIELLLDLAESQPDPYLAEARSLAHIVEAFVAAPDDRATLLPYMTGKAGLALCFLRLASPQHRPPLLSRRGLRRLQSW